MPVAHRLTTSLLVIATISRYRRPTVRAAVEVVPCHATVVLQFEDQRGGELQVPAPCPLQVEARPSISNRRKRPGKSRREAAPPHLRDQQGEVGKPRLPLIGVGPPVVCNEPVAIPPPAVSMEATALGYRFHLCRWALCRLYHRHRLDHPCRALGVCVSPPHHAHH